MTAKAMMNLSVFAMADTNYSRVGWRHPASFLDAGLNIERWIELARMLEAAKFDMLFVADQLSAPGIDDKEAFCRSAYIAGFEPLTLHAALSQVTEKLGLAATVNTTWTEPYLTARNLASLDRISKGRAGWNLVTGRNQGDALNFSKERHVEHADRYAMAEEFLDVCRGLWDSFDDDAFVLDKAGGQFVDPAKLHTLNHKGTYFSVKGPLNVPRPYQGHPVIVQAGMSEPARELSARAVDCLFCAFPTIDKAQAFYADVKGRMAQYGRQADELKILPGISVFVADTVEEAEAKLDVLLERTPVDLAIRQLEADLQMDFSGCSPDDPIPPLKPNPSYTDPESIVADARARNHNLGQFARRFSVSKIYYTLVGTPDTVADGMAQWFHGGAADGFNLLPQYVPGTLQDFIEKVIPRLQERGLFRTEYEGSTLREHLGLARPADRSVAVIRQGAVSTAEC